MAQWPNERITKREIKIPLKKRHNGATNNEREIKSH